MSSAASRHPLTWLLAASLVLVAACGGDAPPQTTGQPPAGGTPTAQQPTDAPAIPTLGAPTGELTVDACDLLTDAEILEITGAAVAEKEAGPQSGIYPAGCAWELDGGHSMTVGIRATGGRAYYESYFEPFIGDGDAGSPVEAVTGIGDKAALDDFGGIMAVKGDVLAEVQYTEVFSQGTADKVRNLITAVLAKLP